MIAWPSCQRSHFFRWRKLACRSESRPGYFQFFFSFIVFLPFGFLLFILTADPVIFARFLRKRTSSNIRVVSVSHLHYPLTISTSSLQFFSYSVKLLARYKRDLRTVPTNEKYFFPDNDYVRQVDHIRGYWNSKRKLGVTTHFSEITVLQYGEKPEKRWICIF